MVPNLQYTWDSPEYIGYGYTRFSSAGNYHSRCNQNINPFSRQGAKALSISFKMYVQSSFIYHFLSLVLNINYLFTYSYYLLIYGLLIM